MRKTYLAYFTPNQILEIFTMVWARAVAFHMKSLMVDEASTTLQQAPWVVGEAKQLQTLQQTTENVRPSRTPSTGVLGFPLAGGTARCSAFRGFC